MTRRILAHIGNPDAALPELDWINGRVRILGESFRMACRGINAMIADGTLIVELSRPGDPERAGEG